MVTRFSWAITYAVLSGVALIALVAFIYPALSSAQILGGEIAHYAFEGNAQSTVGTIHGTLSGGPTFVTGVNNQALKLDGINDYASVNNNFNPQHITISAWVKADANMSQSAWVFNKFQNSSNGWGVRYIVTGFPRISIYDDIGGVDGGTNIDVSGNHGEWIHVVAQLNGSTRENKLYINGTLVDSGRTSASGISGFSGNFFIGQRGSNGGYFKGAVDDVRIFNRILSAAEIDDLYENDFTGTEDPTPTSPHTWIEAESVTPVSPMILANDSGASGGKFVVAPNGSGGGVGSVTYTFTTPSSGVYAIWTRTRAAGGSDDSFHLSLDGGTEYAFDLPAPTTDWVWEKTNHSNNSNNPVTYSLTAGQHTLKLRNREDGAELDKLLITSDLSYIPTGTGQGGGTPQAPTATISANPTSVTQGNAATLSWSSTNATSCAGTNFSTGGATSGSVSVSPNTTTTYTIDCSGAGGSATKNTTVEVTYPAPTASLSASPTSVVAGNTSTLSWSSTNTSMCVGTNFSTGGATSGSVNVSPTSNTTYSITCTGAGGTTNEAASVSVIPLLTVLASASPTSGTSPLNVTFTGSASGGTGSYSYAWNFGDGSSVSPLQNPTHTYTTANTYTATITVVSGSQAKSKTVTIAVTAPPPTASFSASPQTIMLGGNSTLGWSSTNATSCTGTNFSTGGATSGSVNVSPTATTTYSLNCVGAGGNVTKTTVVGVTYPVPTATLTANPTSVPIGTSSTLSWTSTNATSCSGTGFATGGASSGSVSVSPTSNTTYSVSCTGLGGEAAAGASVTVTYPQPTASLSVSPSSISEGQSSTLSWSSTNATSCTGTGFATGGASSGSVSVSPTSNTTYSVSCTGLGGSANDSATLTVTPDTPEAGAYYLSPSGSDSNSCSSAQPCKSFSRVGNLVQPGDTIKLKSGTYTGDYTIAIVGTSQGLVTIEPAQGAAPVFSNALVTISGRYVVLTNLTFDDGQVTVTGDNNRVSRSVFKNGAPGGNTSRLSSAVEIIGANNRVDHNEVYDWQRRGLRTRPDEGTTDNIFDHNYLHDFTKHDPTANSGEGMQSGLGASDTALNTGTIFEYNLLEGVEADDEVISLKSSDNIVRYNTFKNSSAVVQNRSGTNNQWLSNTLINVDALAIYGDDHRVIGNKLVNSYLIVRDGNITEDDVITGSGQHPAARNTLVACNTVSDPYYIGIGMRIPGGTNTSGIPAQNTTVAQNTGDVQYGFHTGTQQGSYNCAGTAAVELTPNDVGPQAQEVGAPTATISASPSSITQGQNTSLSWSSTNASSCLGTGFTTGGATSGSISVSPNTTTTYTLACTGAGGSQTNDATVTVTPQTPPNSSHIWIEAESVTPETPMIIASNAQAANGQFVYTPNGEGGSGSVTYTFTLPTSGVYVVWMRTKAQGGSDDSFNVSFNGGTEYASDLPAPTTSWTWSKTNHTNNSNNPVTYSLAAGTHNFKVRAREDGAELDKLLITKDLSYTPTGVGESGGQTQAPTATISASPSSITQGQNTTLSWSSTNASSCLGTGFATGGATSGSLSVSPNTTTTYTLACTGAGGSANDNVVVSVSVDTSSQELPQATRVINVSNDAQLQAAVAAAVPGDHILLASGAYNQKLVIDEQGTESKPIVIRSSEILGAHLAAGFELRPTSRHIWLYGIDLKDAESRLEGENHVLRRVRIWPPFKETGAVKGIRPAFGNNARIDYCEIRMYTTPEVQQKYGKVWANNTSYGAIQHYWSTGSQDWFDNLTIERCLLTGGPSNVAYSAPNSQFIETSGQDQTGQGHDVNWIVRNVYGDVPRDRTLMDFKHRSMHLDRVHIKSDGGTIQIRNACCHTIKDSRFENTIITVNGHNSTIDNTLAGRFSILAGDKAWNDFSNASAHRQATNTLLRHTIGLLNIGYQYSPASSYPFPALSTISEAHQGTLTYGNHQNTTVRTTSSLPKKTPVTLNASVVGPFAPWVGVE